MPDTPMPPTVTPFTCPSLNPRDISHAVAPLRANTIHVWYYHYHHPDLQNHLDASASSILSTQEQTRARAFVTSTLQQQYRAAHAGKRLILAAYLSKAPQQIVFTQQQYGKPEIIGDHAAQNQTNHNDILPASGPVKFNLSHSHGWSALAIAQCPVGVDIEYIETGKQSAMRWPEIVQQTAHPHERVGNATEFYQLWCAKEAASKWDGRGLGLPFHNLYIERDTQPTGYGQVSNTAQTDFSCQINNLPAPPQMAAAVAWAAPVHRILCHVT